MALFKHVENQEGYWKWSKEGNRWVNPAGGWHPKDHPSFLKAAFFEAADWRDMPAGKVRRAGPARNIVVTKQFEVLAGNVVSVPREDALARIGLG